MNQSLAQFCLADDRFFDVPERISDDASRFATTRLPAPRGWVREQVGLSVSVRPEDADIPDQGWKIHVSSTLDDAERVVDTTYDFCVGHGLPFKFVRSRDAALAVSSKYWPRSASGKLVTIYPRDDAQLTLALTLLDETLRGVTGPYILSDLRYGAGPLFVRYGAFREMWHRQPDGSRVAAIRRPDGQTVPDVRGATFRIPDFVEVPEVLRTSVDDPPGHSDDFPYAWERALHFSNGGGVYAARHETTDETVVLREARPHAGLDGRGRDAVTRLRNERDILQRLDGLPCIPKVLDYINAWEHEFLVLELVPGRTLLEEIVGRYPLVHPEQTAGQLEEYVAWTARVGTDLKAALEAIHARGVAVTDLHPSNILVRPDGGLVLIDFETSRLLDDSSPAGLGSPGFAAPGRLSAREADQHALARVELMTWLPIVPVVGLAPEKAQTLVRAAAEHLPISLGAEPGPLDPAARLFADGDWPSIRRALVTGILRAATPERRDRLFPGDPLQFSVGGASLAYGAAGVLLALSHTGSETQVELVDWLCDAARSTTGCTGSGLYDGLHGVAYVLERLGRRDEALEVLGRAAEPSPDAGWGLFGGASGIVLSSLHFGRLTEDDRLHGTAVRAAEEIRGRILAGELPDARRAGLFHGMTGPALMCLHLFAESGQSAYLDAAEKALRADLMAGELLEDGTFHLRVGPRRLAYLDGGSTGVALVLARLLQHREDEELSRILAAVRRTWAIPFVLQPGLFQGRAGLLAALGEWAVDGTPERETLLRQVGRLGWYAVGDDDAITFPGSGLMRLSTDLATGSAGVLLALVAAYQDGGFSLPYLSPPVLPSPGREAARMDRPDHP